MTRSDDRQRDISAPQPDGDAADARWEQFRDGSLGDEDRRAFEARLSADARKAQYQHESQWLEMLGETPAFADSDVFTQRVLDEWQAQRGRHVLRKIGPRGVAAMAVGWAALLALAVGLSQTSWWNGSLQSPQASSAVSALVLNANRRYDEQAMRVAQVVDRSSNLMGLSNFVGLLIEPAANSPAFFGEPSSPPSGEVQPADPGLGRIE